MKVDVNDFLRSSMLLRFLYMFRVMLFLHVIVMSPHHLANLGYVEKHMVECED
jgi:hypothetical protein